LGYLSVSTYYPRRGRAFNPATKKLVEYGLAGLLIAVVLVAGLQLRPQGVLPTQGLLQISIGDPVSIACQNPGANVTLTSLVVTISSVRVHRSGALNLTGEWRNVTNAPKSLDLLHLNDLTQLGSISITQGTITSVRLEGVSAIGTTSSGKSINVTVSSDHLQVNPNATVISGMKTSIVVHPHVVCEGNGIFRLTPELSAAAKGPEAD